MTWSNSTVDRWLRDRDEAVIGARRASLDVADEGKDLNAFVGVYGCVVETIEEWSGVGDDLFRTAQRAFSLCDANGYDGFRYDADGLGAGIRGNSRILNEGRTRRLEIEAFRGSGPVFDPEGEVSRLTAALRRLGMKT